MRKSAVKEIKKPMEQEASLLDSGFWVMLTKKLPTQKSPPKMSIFWSLPFPDEKWQQSQMYRHLGGRVFGKKQQKLKDILSGRNGGNILEKVQALLDDFDKEEAEAFNNEDIHYG